MYVKKNFGGTDYTIKVHSSIDFRSIFGKI